MPPLPPPPMPPTPAPTIHDLSGGGWYDVSSGGTTGSATSGTTSGTFAEYTQWMSIEYTRNPNYTKDSALPYYALNALSATKDVYSTKLHVVVTVYNSCKFVKGNFTLSSYTQSQKFALDANKYDKMGISYGEVTGVNNYYVFGPQGKIYTTQPYIKRELKTDADVEYALMQQGVNGYYSLSAGSYGPFGPGDDVDIHYTDYLYAYQDVSKGTDFPIMSCHNAVGLSFPLGGGGYNTSAEPGFGNNTLGAQHMINFIETAAGAFQTTQPAHRLFLPQPTDGIHVLAD